VSAARGLYADARELALLPAHPIASDWPDCACPFCSTDDSDRIPHIAYVGRGPTAVECLRCHRHYQPTPAVTR
jgi:hypothetical protein